VNFALQKRKSTTLQQYRNEFATTLQQKINNKTTDIKTFIG